MKCVERVYTDKNNAFVKPVQEFIKAVVSVCVLGCAIWIATIHDASAEGTPSSAGAASALSITVQPMDQTALPGGQAVFSVKAIGTPPLAYQWKHADIEIPGETDRVIFLEDVTRDQAGSYSVVVSNPIGSTSSEIAMLTVPGPPLITVQPEGQTVLPGGQAVLSVKAIGAPPLTYQWRYNGNDISGETERVIFLEDVTLDQAGNYTVAVFNPHGSTTSEIATLTVPGPPLITVQPEDQIALPGVPAVLSVKAIGAPPLTYQWRYNGNDISGETERVIFLEDLTRDQAGNYSVVVSNPLGSISSEIARLTVPGPPIITVQPKDRIALPGVPAVLSVKAIGAPPLTYQWRYNGNDISGETERVIFLEDVTLDQAGNYTVAVFNPNGSTTSEIAILAVPEPPTVEITKPVNRESFAPGSDLAIAVDVTNSVGTVTNVEFYAGITKVGEDGIAPYHVTWESVGGGEYALTALAVNSFGLISTSAPVRISVEATNHSPRLDRIPDGNVVEGELLMFRAEASDPDLPPQTLTYSLGPDAPSGASINPISGDFAWTPSEAQGSSTNWITATVTDDGSPVLSDSKTFTVIVNEVNSAPILAPIADQTVTAGESVTFVASATDKDIPSNRLTFLVESAESNEARIDPKSGVFTWRSVNASQLPVTNEFIVHVTDNGSPPSSDSERFRIIVLPEGNTPPIVRIVAPWDQTILKIHEVMRIVVEAEDPDAGDRVGLVELYVGSTKLAEFADSPPYTFDWHDAQVGDYELTAIAVDDQGAIGSSEPVRIAVSDNTCEAAALVIEAGTSEEIELREALFELGIESITLTPEMLIQANLSDYGLIIWVQPNGGTISTVNISKLTQLKEAGKKLYFIGPELASAASTTDLDEWKRLVHLEAVPKQTTSGLLAIDTGSNNPVLKDGKAGTVGDFIYSYSGPAVKSSGFEGEAVLGWAGESHLLVSYNDESLTQAFSISMGGDEESKVERDRLFKNAVSWLLCGICDNVNVHPMTGEERARGEVFRDLVIMATVQQQGACEALDVRATFTMLPGQVFQKAITERGSWTYTNGVVTFELGRMIRGAIASVEIVLTPTKAGTFSNDLEVSAANETGGAVVGNMTNIETEVSGLTLSIGKIENGNALVTADGLSSSTVTLQASTNLSDWQPVDTRVLSDGQAVFDVSIRAAEPPRFFRAIQP